MADEGPVDLLDPSVDEHDFFYAHDLDTDAISEDEARDLGYRFGVGLEDMTYAVHILLSALGRFDTDLNWRITMSARARATLALRPMGYRNPFRLPQAMVDMLDLLDEEPIDIYSIRDVLDKVCNGERTAESVNQQIERYGLCFWSFDNGDLLSPQEEARQLCEVVEMSQERGDEPREGASARLEKLRALGVCEAAPESSRKPHLP